MKKKKDKQTLYEYKKRADNWYNSSTGFLPFFQSLLDERLHMNAPQNH